jgi:hypothetical protein
MRKQKDQSIPRLKISEVDVQQAVVLMLELDGWRAIRTDPVSDKSRGKGFGEVGMPDYLFIRYHGAALNCPDLAHANPSVLAQVLWIEFKAPGKFITEHQGAWHLAERLRGSLVMVFDSVDGAREWYKTSGLMRHQILS